LAVAHPIFQAETTHADALDHWMIIECLLRLTQILSWEAYDRWLQIHSSSSTFVGEFTCSSKWYLEVSNWDNVCIDSWRGVVRHSRSTLQSSGKHFRWSKNLHSL
jgi:hypothetical protein